MKDYTDVEFLLMLANTEGYFKLGESHVVRLQEIASKLSGRKEKLQRSLKNTQSSNIPKGWK